MVGEDLCFWSAPNFGQKFGLNLSENLFFWSSPNFGQKIGLTLGETIFILIFVILKVSEVPGPSPFFFKILRRYCLSQSILKSIIKEGIAKRSLPKLSSINTFHKKLTRLTSIFAVATPVSNSMHDLNSSKQ